jgi:hypothetical protein
MINGILRDFNDIVGNTGQGMKMNPMDYAKLLYIS